jgi:uncharacterized protein (TIGR00251 family)
MSDARDLYTIGDDAIILSVHVQPRAGRSAVVGRHGSALKVRVAAPPVDERANAATVAVLAEALGVAPGAVELVSGARSRLKRFRIRSDDVDAVAERIDRAVADADRPPGPTPHRGAR